LLALFIHQKNPFISGKAAAAERTAEGSIRTDSGVAIEILLSADKSRESPV
jgi:hypothetical protein